MTRKGSFVTGRWQALPADAVTMPDAKADPSRLYEIRIQTTESIPPQKEYLVADTIWNQLRVPGMALLGVDVAGKQIRLQVSGVKSLIGENAGATAGFPWETLIGGLPSILTGVGVLIAFLTVLIFMGLVPQWAWGVLVLAGAASLVLYAFSQIMTTRRRD